MADAFYKVRVARDLLRGLINANGLFFSICLSFNRLKPYVSKCLRSAFFIAFHLWFNCSGYKTESSL